MEIRLACIGVIFLPVFHADLLKELFHHAFHGEEISVAVHSECKLHPLLRKLCQRQRFRKIDIAQLIQAHIFVSPVIIRSKRCKHPV